MKKIATNIHKVLQRPINKKLLRMLHGSRGAVFSKRVPLAAGGKKIMEIDMVYEINFTLNGEERKILVSPNETLLNVLRYKLGITSTKSGCEEGSCGTCTVKLNGLIVKSCLILAVEIDGQELATVEGLMTAGLTALQQSFLKHNSFQCGYCAPGMVMAAEELLENTPNPTDEEIKEGLAGNLCRCTGYIPIIEAVKDHVKGGGGHE